MRRYNGLAKAPFNALLAFVVLSVFCEKVKIYLVVCKFIFTFV